MELRVINSKNDYLKNLRGKGDTTLEELPALLSKLEKSLLWK